MEETCPFCGDPKAYVGLHDVECRNRNCRAYSERQAADVAPKASGSKRYFDRVEVGEGPFGPYESDYRSGDPGTYDLDQVERIARDVASRHECEFTIDVDPGGGWDGVSDMLSVAFYPKGYQAVGVDDDYEQAEEALAAAGSAGGSPAEAAEEMELAIKHAT